MTNQLDRDVVVRSPKGETRKTCGLHAEDAEHLEDVELDAEDAECLDDAELDAEDAGRLEDAELDAEEAERLEDAELDAEEAERVEGPDWTQKQHSTVQYITVQYSKSVLGSDGPTSVLCDCLVGLYVNVAPVRRTCGVAPLRRA